LTFPFNIITPKKEKIKMKTRLKPLLTAVVFLIAGRQLHAQSIITSYPVSQSDSGSKVSNSGKTLDDVRESLRAKKQTPGTNRTTGNPGTPGEGAGEGMMGSGGGSSGGMGMGMGMGSGGMSSGGNPSGMGMGMGMGMMGGDSSGGYGGGSSGMGGPTSEKQMLIQLIQKLRERLKSNKYKREDVEKLLRSVLADYFQIDMEERVREFDKVKARVAEMESKLQNRLDRQKEVIELQTLQILHKADGLEFAIPGGDSGSGYGGGRPGMGMSGSGMGSDGEGGGNNLFGSAGYGMGGGMPGMGGGGLESGESALVLGYDIGFGATKYLRVESDPKDPNDPLVSYSSMKPRSPIVTISTAWKMKSILNAMIGFSDVFQHLPGAVNRHVQGQPPHSWRVAILPLLGHSDLYREYRFNEPWDSPNNSKLIPKMPEVYSAVNDEQSKSSFFVITGVETAFPLDRPTSLSEITDGTSNTIGIVMASLDFPWTKPEDIASQAAIQLLSTGGEIGMIDGSVGTLPKENKSLVQGMITRSGAEVIDHFQIVKYQILRQP